MSDAADSTPPGPGASGPASPNTTDSTNTTNTADPTAAPPPPKAPEPGTPAAVYEQLRGIGMVGERKALSLAILGFFSTFLFLIAMGVKTEAPEWFPAFFALLMTYTITFFGLAAGWFWGRWVATGLAYWGMTVTIMAFVTTRQLPPPLLIFGIGHLIVWLCIQGPKMALQYEARPEWKKRWGLDDDGVAKLRASVTRAASSLPALILFALAPRDGAGAALALLAISGFGLLLAGRTLGVLVLGWAGLVTVAAGAISLSTGAAMSSAWVPYGVPLVPMGFAAGFVLLAATVPFVRPAVRYLRSLR